MGIGEEFEDLVAEEFSNKGYDVKFTPTTNDHGIDLIMKRGKDCVAVQCKHISKPVGREVFQKLDSAMRHHPYGRRYRFNRGFVVSSSGFSSNAIEWVQENNNRAKYKRFVYLCHDSLNKYYDINDSNKSSYSTPKHIYINEKNGFEKLLPILKIAVILLLAKYILGR